MPTAVIVLAAGQGTRMNSDLPKVLHPLAGAPLIAHALATARAIEPERIVVVTGTGADEVAAAAHAIDPDIRIVQQPEQLGTGHAVLQAAPVLDGFRGDAVVLYGDTPFVRPDTLRAMLASRAAGAAIVVLGFESAAPGGYGRLVRDTRADLKPALDHLDGVVDVLNKNQENLDASLRLMAPFYRVFASTLGNGPWFDTYIQNLPPVPSLGNGGGLGVPGLTDQGGR